MIATPKISHFLGLCLSASLGMSCATTEESKETTTTTEPKTPTLSPVSPPVVNEAPTPTPPDAGSTSITAAIASVQLNQDCPNKPNGPAMKMAPGPPMPGAARGKRSRSTRGFKQPCRQSAMQLSFTGQDKDTEIRITAIRLLSTAGKDLGSLMAREPTMFSSTGYTSWNEVVPADADLKASYKLSIPNWNDVDKALGAPSVGVQFTLEVDLEANGKTLKLSSPSFGRTRPQMIRT